MSGDKYKLGDDGEIFKYEDDNRKSKRGLYRTWRDVLFRIASSVMLVLIGVVGGVMISRTLLPESSASPLSTAFPTVPTVMPFVTAQPITVATPVGQPVIPTPIPITSPSPLNGFPLFQTEGPALVISLNNGDMFGYSTDNGLVPLSFKGVNVAASIDSKTFAFVGIQPNDQIFIYRNDKLTTLNSFANHRELAWGPKGKTFAYLVSGMDNQGHTHDYLQWLKITYSYNIDTGQFLGSAPSISGPPLTDPVSGRLLIADNISLTESTFFLVDPMCNCDGTLGWKELTTVPYSVNWYTYNSTGSQIIFSEDNGHLYALATDTKNITPFLADSTEKYGPTMSPDDKQITYFDNMNNVYIMNLVDKHVQKIALPDSINSLTWVGD